MSLPGESGHGDHHTACAQDGIDDEVTLDLDERSPPGDYMLMIAVANR
jgi:hypothetical protein